MPQDRRYGMPWHDPPSVRSARVLSASRCTLTSYTKDREVLGLRLIGT
jgi:hypothetical protein